MRVAVIGTGIAGLAAAWALDRVAGVTVYEQEGRIGGHSNTVDVPAPVPGGSIAVDTGFIVFNDVTYPNLVRLFRHLGVASRPSTMSFAVSLDGGRLEYSGSGPAGLFAQPANLARRRHWGMIADILRFWRQAPALLDEAAGDPSLGEFLAAGGYGQAFIEDHLLPMGAAIWSCPPSEMPSFPARSFIRFFHNHGLLSLAGRPHWRTVEGGARTYVEALAAPLAGRIRRGVGAARVVRDAAGVTVADAGGGQERFDQVVIAAHADQALALLADPCPDEARVLGAFRYQKNRAVLHADPRLMPRRRRAWASWNYLGRTAGPAPAAVSVTYWMNLLQSLDPAFPLFVTLNPLEEPRPGSAIATFAYDHPVLDRAAIAAQGSIAAIQGLRRTWFCGSWCGWGFHEDGLSAGLAVAECLGARRPWTVAEASPAAANVRPAGRRAEIAAA